MAIFGKFDAKVMDTGLSVTSGDATVTCTGDFTDASSNKIDAGDILELAFVSYLVVKVTSATSLELHKPYEAATGTLQAQFCKRRTAPKAVAEYVVKGGDSASYELLFVDSTEATTASSENASRGITGPGWWQYRTHVDSDGNTRHKAECLAFLNVAAATSGDDEDKLVADVASAVTITAQPAASTSSSGAGTFTLTTTTTGTPGTLTYKWQRQTAAATTRWVDIAAGTDTGVTYADFTTATLAYSGLAADGLDGYKYRVKITSTGGTEEVISDGVATLTFSD